MRHILVLSTASLLLIPLACSVRVDDGADTSATGASTSMDGTGSTTSVPGSGGTSSGDGGSVGTGGQVEGSGGMPATGGDTSTGGATGVSCTPGTGTEDYGTSSFVDKATCLVWQKTDTHVGSITNRGALAHCNALTQDGLTWRLPTAQELRTYPMLADAGNAYLTGPTYIPSASADNVMQGCVDNSHSCNLTQYSAGNFGCGWQGPGAGGYGVLCVSGDAEASSLDPAFSVATCCSASSGFVEADCSPY